MDNWIKYQIADLIKSQRLAIGDGYRAKNSELTASFTDGIPFARVKNINGGFDFSDVDFFPLKNIEIVGNKVSVHGDTVFTSKGTVGRFAFVTAQTQRFIYSPQLCFWRSLDSELINTRFLYYWMHGREFFAQVEAVKSQTDMADYVNLADQRQMNITLPPLPEQQAIASVLTSLDDKIDLLHRQNKTLEAIAQTLFRQWFVEKAEDDWEKHQLDDFVEVMRGLSYKGAGLTEEGFGVPMHNLNSVYEGGGYKYEGIKHYKGVFKERHRISPGDIIITNTEQGHDLLLIGYPAIVPKFFGNDGIFSQHIYRLQIHDSCITPHFLYYLLMSHDVREQITGATNGSTVNMLPKDGIEWAMFRLPPFKLIEQFSEIVQPIWEQKEANYIQTKTLADLRDTLLPKLMSGEVRVSELPDSDSASHDLFDRAGYLSSLLTDALQSTPAETEAAPVEDAAAIPLAWFAIPETLYQLAEQPFPPTVGQTIFQKMCFVLTDEGVETGFDFVPHDYGPYSTDAEQALSRFEVAGLIEQTQAGSMTEVRVQAAYQSQREGIVEALGTFQPMIERTVELFTHVKNTHHAEEIATILYSARQIERKHNQREVKCSELHEHMIAWKPHWDKARKRNRLDSAIDGLVKMGFIALQEDITQ